jgi:hypothetical protein
LGEAIGVLVQTMLGSIKPSQRRRYFRRFGQCPGLCQSPSHAVNRVPGQAVECSVTLQSQVEQQKIQVNAPALTVDADPGNNANEIVFKSNGLDALSDDPYELQDQLQALAGSSAGPYGGPIYGDGFHRQVPQAFDQDRRCFFNNAQRCFRMLSDKGRRIARHQARCGRPDRVHGHAAAWLKFPVSAIAKM